MEIRKSATEKGLFIKPQRPPSMTTDSQMFSPPFYTIVTTPERRDLPQHTFTSLHAPAIAAVGITSFCPTYCGLYGGTAGRCLALRSSARGPARSSLLEIVLMSQ